MRIVSFLLMLVTAAWVGACQTVTLGGTDKDEICGNGFDDDEDQLTDCDDEDCADDPGCDSGGCTEDSFEENDTLQNAAPVDEGVYSDLTACLDDYDFYSIGLMTGELLEIRVYFSHAQGDIDLRLYDASGTMLAMSNTDNDEEDIDYTASTDGTYAIQVYTYGDDSNSYDLSIYIR